MHQGDDLVNHPLNTLLLYWIGPERPWAIYRVPSVVAGVCSVLDIILSNPSQHGGFVAQEEFRLGEILDNRFGHFFAHGSTNITSAELVARGETGHQRSGAGE